MTAIDLATEECFETVYNKENGTITQTLWAKDGNEYRITYKPVETEVSGYEHIYIDDKLNQIISKVRVKGVTIKPAGGPAQRAMQRQRLKSGL